jgi:hypothetical protein
MGEHPIIETCRQRKIPLLGSVLDRGGLKLWPASGRSRSIGRICTEKVNCLLPGAPMATKSASLKDKILYRIEAKKPFAVWTSRDFIVLASRKLVDKTLQQLARSGELRRIGRGLYDKPGFDSLTNQPTSPDYREVIKAVSRRD